jgi:hypothetical protein
MEIKNKSLQLRRVDFDDIVFKNNSNFIRVIEKGIVMVLVLIKAINLHKLYNSFKQLKSL